MTKSITLIALCSLTLLGCSSPSNPALVASINSSASLSGDLPADPFQWQVITSVVDLSHSTMSVLYGNDIAIQYARTNSGHDYPAGAQLALVTWTRREDPRWFGANIPGPLQSVEYLALSEALLPLGASTPRLVPAYTYKRFEGSPPKLANSWTSTVPDLRVNFMLALQPSLFP